MISPPRRSFISELSPSILKHCSAAFMAFMQKVQHHLPENVIYSLTHLRFYNSKVDWTRLRPMILEQINNRTKDYHMRSMVSVASDVLKARVLLTEGVSTLLRFFPVKSCRFCPEVHIGDTGHQIKTCRGFKRIFKNRAHQWRDGNLNDILTSLEAFHLNSHVPAVVKLCHQAGAKISTESLYHHNMTSNSSKADAGEIGPLLPEELSSLAQRTLEAWETLRSGVQKLLLVSPVKVCKYCSEVHVGPSEYKARLREVFEHRRCRGSHRWKKGGVDDLVPPKMVWHRRPQDPEVFVDSGRDFYGRAPAVVELCVQAGARVPSKYSSMMKVLGLTAS